MVFLWKNRENNHKWWCFLLRKLKFDQWFSSQPCLNARWPSRSMWLRSPARPWWVEWAPPAILDPKDHLKTSTKTEKKKHQTPGRSKKIEVKFWENYDRTWIREITNDSPGSSIIVQGIGNAWKRTNQQDYTKTASPTNHEMSFKLVRIYGMYSSLTWYHNVP